MRWLLVALVMALSACGGGGSSTSTPQASTVDPSKINVSNADRCDFLDQSECLYPFPNDYFTTSDIQTVTGRRVNFNILSMPANVNSTPIDPTDWNRADGFSPGQAIITKVPGLGDEDALKNTDPVSVDNIGAYLNADQPVVVIDTETGQRWPIWVELDQAPDVSIVNSRPVLQGPPPAPSNAALLIRPARNFIEGHHYIVALRDLKDDNDNTIPASVAFRVYRDDIATDIPAIEQRRAHMDAIFSALKLAGIPRDNLYLAWDFTVASRKNITGRELYMRDNAFAQLGDVTLDNQTVEGSTPAFQVDKFTNYQLCDPSGCQSGQSNRLLRTVQGTVTVPCYLNQQGCPVGSQFAFTASSSRHPTIIPGNTYKAQFICNIPRAVVDANGNVVPSRLAIYGHGLFGSPTEVNAGNVKDMSNEHDIIFCAARWIGMSDQDQANSVAIFQDLSNFPELVDRTEQGLLDFMYLGRAMIHPDGFVTNPAFQVKNKQGNPVPAIDPSHLYYDGNSQGGIFGGTLMALEPDITHGVLGVPGMNYSTLVTRSVDFAPFAQVLYPSYPDRLQRPLLLGLMQMLWDRSDPDGYAQNMTTDPLPNTPPHQVLMQVAYGDHQVTNWAAGVEARTIGAQLHTPALDADRLVGPDQLFGIPAISAYPYDGSAIVFWDSGPVRRDSNSGDIIGTTPPPLENVPDMVGQDPHGLPRSDASARVQKSDFLQPNGQVIDVCNGKPCYDAGYTGSGG